MSCDECCGDPLHCWKELRAENERLRGQNAAEVKRSEDWIEIAQDHCTRRDAAESRLAAATALIRRWHMGRKHDDELEDDTEAFLRNQPAAPTRTEAEQAVLDAMEHVALSALQRHINGSTEMGAACRAELALRGLK